MTGTVILFWRIDPASPPRPHLHCGTCGRTRPFHPSGKVRLNANGRRLDAWLIYKCETCDRTWNLPLVERAPVASIPAADLHAMQHSDPDWVRARTFDLARLKRHADRIELDQATRLHGQPFPEGDWSVVALTLDAPVPIGDRLDRLLARALRLTRADLRDMQRTGALVLGHGAALNRPVRGSLTLRLVAAALTDRQRRALSGHAEPP